MKATKVMLMSLALFILILLLGCLFTVTQGEQAILLRLGRLIQNSDTHEAKVLLPGLKCRLLKPYACLIHGFKPWILNHHVL